MSKDFSLRSEIRVNDAMVGKEFMVAGEGRRECGWREGFEMKRGTGKLELESWRWWEAGGGELAGGKRASAAGVQ
jgi:hypothetical protein